jgi:hypothetical protein
MAHDGAPASSVAAADGRGETTMLDPREQKKGGFGAFVDRENARGNAERTSTDRLVRDASVTPIGDAPSLLKEGKTRVAPAPQTTLAERTVERSGDRPLPVEPEPRP